MSKSRRKSRTSGVLTVLILVGASVLLIIVGSLLRGTPRRRAPQPQPAASAPAEPGGAAAPEITSDERRDLERVLREKDAQ